MTSKTPGKSATRRAPAAKQSGRDIRRLLGRHSGNRGWTIVWTLLAIVALGSLYLLYDSSANRETSAAASGTASGYAHAAGAPGAGAAAPQFSLPASTGGQKSLSDYRGQSVLLYFQEGLMCQPCWEQITDLEQNRAGLQAAGIDEVVSITTDPADLVARKTADMGLSTPVLSDPTLEVSRAYTTNQYGMMGDSRNGHSFILVGPDGTIDWRADYGGAPDYTMYLPTENMLADLRVERQ